MVRIAVIDRSKCKAPKDCDYLCIKYCPVAKTGKEIFTILNDKKPAINEELCIGCGICVKRCPFNAITIVNLPEEFKEDPVFQYGPNTFRLYRLPIVRLGKFIGILGPNGIGKSTTLKILSGILKPNFGRYSEESKKEEIIRRFRGSELQSYFENLYDGKISVSIKPQEITKMRKLYGEKKVRELLERVNENNRMEELIERFNLKNILDREVKYLSGGELQKIAIVASFLKNANVFYLDEPTAFLDIRERFNLAMFLDSERSENKSLILVEHDLTFLDYVTDETYIVYGKPKVYGIFSKTKSTRHAINEYLEGFLREENIRIRDKKIIFEIKSGERQKYESYVTSWKNFTKTFTSFKLEVSSGEIGIGEIVGVLGPNGIGKSTFAKIISGKMNPDEETEVIEKEIKISYKPQYLELTEEIEYLTVRDFLRKVNREAFSDYYIVNLLRPLGITELLDRTLSELSGGELQITMVSATLLKEADLYVLDEPSAYLDVEQRINLSKILRDFIKSKEKAAIVIDHDIMFIDYISDSLLIFLGEPGKYGKAYGPLSMKEGMNLFLKDMKITFRRDPDTKRPRINKPGSLLDRKQKEIGEYYYLQ